MAGKVTVDYKEATRKMNEAKTAREIVESWAAVLPGFPGAVDWEGFWAFADRLVGVYMEKGPEILKYYCQLPLGYSMEKGALDPKTRELVMVAALVALKDGNGLRMHVTGAMGQGATEAEIMDTVHLAVYEHAKSAFVSVGEGLKQSFEDVAKAKV